MYFDTIHEIPEFDAVIDPEGYASHWETDTELQTDDEFGSFIFSKLDGDSASVVCVDDDEATSLIERFKLNHRPAASVGDVSSLQQPVEAMYENVDGEDDEEPEHVYESIEDCIDEYQLFLCNEEGSPRNDSTPTHAKVTQKVKHPSPPYRCHKQRSNSLPFSHTYNHVDFKQGRKYSDCSEYAKLSKRHQERFSSSIRDPIPPPLPPPKQPSPPMDTTQTTYTQLFRLPSTTPATTTTHNKSLEQTRKSSPTHQQRVAVLKHKGREYVLPLTDNKSSRRHSSSGVSPKHTPISSGNHMHQSPSTPSHLSNVYSTVSRRSPPQSETTNNMATTPSSSNGGKKKLKHSSTYSSNVSGAGSTCTSSKHLTLYGVL